MSAPDRIVAKTPGGPILIAPEVATQSIAAIVTGHECWEPGPCTLLETAQIVRTLNPNEHIIVLSSDQSRAAGEAHDAAQAVSASVFTPRRDNGEACDFDTLLGAEGIEVVNAQLAEVLVQVQDAAQARRFKLLSVADLLACPRPPQWLVKGYLEAQTLASIYGESGSMKSFVALDMSLCIATGFPYHGLSVPVPGPVVYIAGEGAGGLPKRVQAWSIANEVDLTGAPFHVLGEAVSMLDVVSVDDLTDVIAALPEPPRMVVLDTLARCLDGDENSSQDMGGFVRALDRLRVRFGCCVLVIHHSGHGEKSRGRGSSSLRAALDWEYRLGVNDNTRTLTCAKAKDHEEPAPLHFFPTAALTGWKDEDGHDIGSIVLKLTGAAVPTHKPLTGARRIAYEALVAVQVDGGAHIDLWRAEAYRRGISEADTSEARKKAFQAARQALLDAGRIGVSVPYYWPIPGENGSPPGKLPVIPTGGSGRGVYKTPPSLPVATPGSEGKVGA